MARTRNTDKIQKRLKEEERQAKAAAEEKKAAAEEKKAAAEEKKAAEENQAAKEKKAAAEEEESAEERNLKKERKMLRKRRRWQRRRVMLKVRVVIEVRAEVSRLESARHRRARQELHYVPSVKKHHKSWASFEAYLKSYERRTNTVLVIAETLNVRLRNERMKKQKRYLQKPDSEIPLVPEDMDPYQRNYICTHGWKVRSRSTGLRPVQRVTFTGCKVRFVAQVYEHSAGRWWIQVKLEFYGHNHHVSEEVFRSYPSKRMVPADPPKMSDAELLVNSGSKPSRIYDYIRDNSIHRVKMRDVYNIVTRVKAAGSHGEFALSRPRVG
ncbi:hypothetical protein PF003_g29132 [Phytophthora fragariae]|nr:hypothetical protein PF003_g29132 [Phytophthora fragariae]